MLVTAIIAVAVGVASYSVMRSDPFAERSSSLLTLDLSSLYEIEPGLIQFEQTAEIKVGLEQVRAIGVGPADKLYVAGDRMIGVFSPEGRELKMIQTEGHPSCLAVGTDEHISPGRIYVGAGRKIEVFAPGGESVGVWDVPVSNPILTSIAAASSDIFVADAANRVILHYDDSGELVGKIGAPGEGGDGRVFNVPSIYFDVAVSSAGLLHVANPGVLRIETYTFDGQMEVRWGEAGSAIGDFFGCCNPSQFAVLPSGEVVTSEKGVPRVKVYSEFGEFESVVAGPEQLDVLEAELGDPRSVRAKAVFDVAADSQGRVLVLDPRRKSVRIFTRNAPVESDATDAQPG